MEPSLNLTTLLPALRAVATINPGPDNRTWIITINRGRFQALKITQEGLTALLRGLGTEIVTEERDRLTIRIPSDQPFEEFIISRRNELLALYRPRSLTADEIEDLVNAIPRVFSPIAEIGEHARQEIMQRVREQLAEIKITPLGFDDLKDAIVYRFERARVEPGETVGLTVAEALSALTQAALNAFHQSGQRSNVSAGIEMLQDLLAARVERKVEQANVHFWNKDLTFEEVLAKRAELVEVTVGGRREGNGHVQGILIDYIIDSPENFEPYWWVALYPQLTGRDLPHTTAVVRLELNKTAMYAHNITMEDVARAIETFNTPNIVVVVPGPADSGLMFVYPDEELVIDPLKKKKIPIAENVAETFLNEIFLPTLNRILIKGIPGIRGISPISTTTWGVVDDEIKAATPELLEELLRELTDPIDRQRAERSWILHLSRFVMGREGIIGDKLVTLLSALGFEILEIQDTYITVVAPNDQRPSEYVNQQVSQADQTVNQRRKERLTTQRKRHRARQTGQPLPEVPEEVIDEQTAISRASKYLYAQTQGSNLTALFARPDVDTRRTTSNNPHTILRLIGVEAARNLLISEFIYILETSGLELDPRHIILLTDFMTNRGVLLPISFWGMVRSNPGPLTVASMGKAVNIFRTGAAFGQTERIRTTASAMYVGQRGQFGSGYVDLRIDEAKIRAFEEEMARREAEGVTGIDAQDLENAIDQLDYVTFGAEQELQEADPLAELAALTIDEPVRQTEVGKGTIPRPLEVAKTAAIVSPMVQRTIEGIQVTGTMPTPETTLTITEEPAPEVVPKRRTIPKPVARMTTVRVPVVRRPITTPTAIPKAHI